jgi:hypothetical protein
VTLGTASADLGAKYAWRNRAQTGIGYVWMGGTWLKPDLGETLSFDPYGYASSDTGHTPFNGNPWAFWDADGRVSAKMWEPMNGEFAEAHRSRISFEWRLQRIVEAAGGVWEPPEQRSVASRFWDQAVLGDYAQEDNGVAGIAGQTAMGFVPIAGQIGDIRDLAAAGNDINSQGLNWGTGGRLMISAVAIIPGAGDLAKGLLKPVLRRVEHVPHLPHVETPNSQSLVVGRHGDMPSPRPEGMQSHHGVNSVWMDANHPNYNAADAPAVLMPNVPSHNATRAVFNQIQAEIAQRQGVALRNVDWSQVSPGTAWRLAEEQFRAANIPPEVVQEYFRQFNAYLDTLK